MGLDAGPLEPLEQKRIKENENGNRYRCAGSGLYLGISRLNFKACIAVDNRIRLSNENFKKCFCLDLESEREGEGSKKKEKNNMKKRDKDVTAETIPEYLKEKKNPSLIVSTSSSLYLRTTQFLWISFHPNYLHRLDS